ncbi:hypothetical protein SCL_2670 [Sulfuricaulis limicola]|uniref:Uncharacterized protein n=1 Tax=Sulfuricaulis limicola TaxID=1620215 RepID=A0A1B4XJH1_9GAMM|nr:hypothetical protein [Sulfuricaulis limicola]BAV34947.1 hypothetical protein SCL_2670 [Sulfuricaulis limicola]
MKKGNRPQLRTVIEQPLVAARIKQSKGEYPRLEEMFEAIKWTLARNPLRGAVPISESEEIVGYVIKTLPWKIGRVPSLDILYKLTDNEVIIESLSIREE